MPSIFQRLMPFIVLGIMLVILIWGLILLSYLLIFGAIVGMILFAISWIREKLFSPKPKKQIEKRHGRTIDHDDVR